MILDDVYSHVTQALWASSSHFGCRFGGVPIAGGNRPLQYKLSCSTGWSAANPGGPITPFICV